MSERPPFAALLTELREKAGMSQADLKRALDVDRAFVYRVEKGEVLPSDERIEQIAGILNADADALYIAAGRVPPDLRELFSSDLHAVRWARVMFRRWNEWGQEEAENRSHDHKTVTDGADTRVRGRPDADTPRPE